MRVLFEKTTSKALNGMNDIYYFYYLNGHRLSEAKGDRGKTQRKGERERETKTERQRDRERNQGSKAKRAS